MIILKIKSALTEIFGVRCPASINKLKSGDVKYINDFVHYIKSLLKIYTQKESNYSNLKQGCIAGTAG